MVGEAGDGPDYVSRGGHKLAGALAVFGPAGLAGARPPLPRRRRLHRRVHRRAAARGRGRRWSRSTSGYGQLAWSLRTDPRVTVLDRTNVRDADARTSSAGRSTWSSRDLSFISLRLVLPRAGRRSPRADGDLVLMVKPQFEVGRERLGHGRRRARPGAAGRRRSVGSPSGRPSSGLGVRGVTASPLPGPSGNVEYFLWLRAGAPALDPAAVDRAVAEGPR